jgi:hypothetical protein
VSFTSNGLAAPAHCMLNDANPTVSPFARCTKHVLLVVCCVQDSFEQLNLSFSALAASHRRRPRSTPAPAHPNAQCNRRLGRERTRPEPCEPAARGYSSGTGNGERPSDSGALVLVTHMRSAAAVAAAAEAGWCTHRVSWCRRLVLIRRSRGRFRRFTRTHTHTIHAHTHTFTHTQALEPPALVGRLAGSGSSSSRCWSAHSFSESFSCFARTSCARHYNMPINWHTDLQPRRT